MSFAEFARECDITPVTLSRARHGRGLKPSTLRKLARGLARIKTLQGLDIVISAQPPKV